MSHLTFILPFNENKFDKNLTSVLIIEGNKINNYGINVIIFLLTKIV